MAVAPLLTLRVEGESAMETLGAWLCDLVVPPLFIALEGDLGAGKTTLARGLIRAAGHDGSVKSPTYTLVEPYVVSRLYLYHFDFYRFSRSDEWGEAGFREYFNRDSVCLVEWPEKAGGQLPEPDLEIVMAVEGEGRRVTVSTDTETGRDCISRLQL